MTQCQLNDLTLDPELQPRAAIDRAVLENYVQLLVDGARFPPVVAFREGGVLWLSDGFHRWHAHKVLEADSIGVDIRDGSRRDALLYSLAANSKHGLQRGATDYRRAYEIACRHGLVDPVDSEAVAALLRCSGRWATDLTAKAREAARADRDAQIIRLKDAGKTHREVADAVGVAPRTVTNVQERHNAEIAQAEPPVWRQKLEELSSPPAANWAAVLRALRHINEQPPVDDLFAARFDGFDQVLCRELEAAHEWINELHGRFINERDQRRRA